MGRAGGNETCCKTELLTIKPEEAELRFGLPAWCMDSD